MVANIETRDLVQTPVDGLLGLAFQGIASTGAIPFWLALILDNQLEYPEMSFWLSRSNDPFGLGGEFTLGGKNSNRFTGEVEFINISQSNGNTYWQLSLAGEYSV